jgi:hypothetical protein
MAINGFGATLHLKQLTGIFNQGLFPQTNLSRMNAKLLGNLIPD